MPNPFLMLAAIAAIGDTPPPALARSSIPEAAPERDIRGPAEAQTAAQLRALDRRARIAARRNREARAGGWLRC
jgi:hypothetical protein